MYISLSLYMNISLSLYICIYIYIYIYISGAWKLSGRFRCVSVVHVSATFPSAFPLRFRCVSVAFPSRFRCVSVHISAALPLGEKLIIQDQVSGRIVYAPLFDPGR